MPQSASGSTYQHDDDKVLRARAATFMAVYPDLHDTAYKAAKQIIFKHTGKSMDPEKVYWHRFNGASSSPRSYTGWQHSGPPVESMTFLDLLLRRFDAHDQDASDDLQMLGGFYTAGPDQPYFDETNEVAMLPQAVMKDFWRLDLSTTFTQQIDHFWSTHSRDFCTLSKAKLLSAAVQSRRRGALLDADFQRVVAAVLGQLPAVMTLAVLEKTVSPPAGVTLRLLDVGGIAACDIVRVVSDEGRQLVYVSGASSEFHAFANEQGVYEWVRTSLANPESRAAFELHFLRSPALREKHGADFTRQVEQLLARPWDARQKVLNQTDLIIPGDPFVYLRDIARQQMTADAHFLLTSNASLRKRMWIGYLSAFVKTFGGLAALGWPVALTLIGAGIANVGLNTEQAVNGSTTQQRKAGVLGAVLNSVYVLFNLPFLADVAAEIEPVDVVAEGAQEGTTFSQASELWAPSATEAAFEDPLAGMEGNEILDGTPLSEDTKMRGIHLLPGGQTWISLNDMPYQVRWLEAHATWAIVDPANPFAFDGARWVVLGDSGEWQLLAVPKLRGGSPMDEPLLAKPYATTASPFWDTYMQFNLDEEERLSALALERQQAIVAIPELETDDEVFSDSEGEDVHVDAWGAKHRVFKTRDDFYFGGNILAYTHDDGVFNQFLRTGVVNGPEQVEGIEKLIEDLEHVAANNDVALYRGASGARGTSGLFFRQGSVKAGDILVNTDITSFSENPYIARAFASSQGGVSSYAHTAPITLDDTSVVFVLPEKSYVGASPIAPFSSSESEAESVFLPGHYFRVDSIEEVAVVQGRFMKVQLREVMKSESGPTPLDLRTGEPFSREQYAAKLGTDAKVLVDYFFP